MKTSKNIEKVYTTLFSIALIYFITICVTYLVCFINGNFLYDLIIKYDTAKNLPFSISDSDLRLIVTDLMDFLCEKSAFLETKVTINGVLTDFYSIRSRIHMGDVRQLFHNILFSSYVAIAICVITGYKIASGIENPLKKLRDSYIKVLIVFGSIIAILFIFAVINFDTFFTLFHKVLFRNDYWLLDPNTDYIICLLPEEIFMEYGIRIVIITALCLVLLALLFQLLLKIQPLLEAKLLHETSDQEVVPHQDPSHLS